MTSWTDATKIFDPISNKVIQAEFVQTMVAQHPLFANYYDPANITIEGGIAEYFGGQMSEGCPIEWKRGFTRADWPHSKNFRQRLIMVQYGLFGDISSYNFGRLAFENPDMLRKVFDSKLEVIVHQWKRATEGHILYNLCDKSHYSEGGWEELPRDYFKVDTSGKATLDCQARALSFINKIETRAYKFLEYTDKYNKESWEAVTPSLQFLTLILDPSVNTFLNTYAYSSAFNVSYLELKQKIGKIIVKRLGSYKKGDVIYRQFKSDGSANHGVAIEGRHTFNWKALLHDSNFYKIRDAINHPEGEGIFVNSKDYDIDLTSYAGKWWFAFEGVIRFVNASAWVQTGLDSDELTALKPKLTSEEKKTAKDTKKTAKKTALDTLAARKKVSLAKLGLEWTPGNKVTIEAMKTVEARRKELHPKRVAHAIRAIHEHFLKKSATSTHGTDKKDKKFKGKTLEQILGTEWGKKTYETNKFPDTVETNAEFNTVITAEKAKIDNATA